ncbi:S8 family serine peptidase [Microbispora sp. GKU 823]|uniref:S8 family serine peptidase n=1 Tax=Microbispora sp. GKU 823 TaxID=1652100 RepID=UPI0009A362E9|nr:S8 family serine peptidase [Microbispora sp. GKU 823]OPG03502.1 serine protease [Microbispora sp. GKU 823]
MSRNTRVHRALTLAAALAVTATAPGVAQPAAAAAPPATAATPYIVTLAEPPLATYDGGVQGIAPTKGGKGRKVDTTSANARRYRERLTRRQDEVARGVGATATAHHAVASNSFTAELAPAQALRLHATQGVVSVVPDTLHKALDDRVSTDFLRLPGDRGLWAGLGGADKAGKGVVVGVIDTGIWPENHSFAGPALGTEPPTDAAPYRPYLKDGVTVMKKADGSTFTGLCQTGEEFTANLCNQKVISARYFGEQWMKGNPPDKRADYISPRDAQGHGSHTAGTAAGDKDVPAAANGIDFGTISGVAPGAAIAVYKALWQGKDGGTTGGYTSDLVAAVDQAVADGVDVINYSIGSSVGESAVDDPIQLAFLAAAQAGVFVSTAGGNSGPDPSTLDNTAPWTTTVAAGTIAPYQGEVRLGDGTAYRGTSTTVVAPLGPKPLVTAVSVKAGTASDSDAQVCAAGSLDPAKAAGKIVYCVRGVTTRVDKSAEVKRAGGAGMVLGNPSDQDTDADLHAVPTVHVNAPDADKIAAYADTAGATATLLPASSDGVPYPQVASFSSRGPALSAKGDLLKPDITAPGSAILAAVAPPGNAGKNFDFYSGTSMATPHIAGLATLYLGRHPLLSPMAIKSAMMTTAYDTKTPDVFAQGAGHVDPARMLDPGLVYDAGAEDWFGFLEGLGIATGTGVKPLAASDLNYPTVSVSELFGSRTVTREVTAVTPGVYKASIGLPGYKTKIKPSTLVFKKAGETKNFTVTMEMLPETTPATATGTLTWTGAGTSVRSAIVATPLSARAPAEVKGTGADGSVTFEVTPGLRKFTITPYGPVSADEAPGSVSDTEAWGREVPVTIPEDAKAAAFKITGIDPEAQVGGMLFYDGNGTREFESWVFGLDGDNRGVLSNPRPGRHTLVVLSLGDLPGTTSTAFTTQINVVTGNDARGALTVTPAKPKVTVGTPFPLTASWTGAAQRTNTGYVEYPNGGGTIVTIN